MEPAFPQAGGCVCAAIRYELRSDPVTLYACHCTDCQAATGASYALSMIVPSDALALVLVRGAPRYREFDLPGGRRRREFGCDACGTILWGQPRFPELRNLQPGTLDDTSWFRPVGHIWVRSAQPWVTIPEDALRYEMQPDDFLPLVRAWKARAEGQG